jgi:hypothetical protein
VSRDVREVSTINQPQTRQLLRTKLERAGVVSGRANRRGEAYQGQLKKKGDFHVVVQWAVMIRREVQTERNRSTVQIIRRVE